MRDLGGGGPQPPPNSQPDGGAVLGLDSCGRSLSSGELAGSSCDSGGVGLMKVSSACEEKSLPGMSDDLMEEGEATPDGGKISCDIAVRCIRDLGGDGPRPSPNSRPDGGAISGVATGGRSLSSGGLEWSSCASGVAGMLRSSPACVGKSLSGMSGDLMEDGEANPDVGKVSCDTGMTESPLDFNGKDVHGDRFGLGSGDSQIKNNAEFDKHLCLHVDGGMHAHILPPPNNFCMGVSDGIGAGQSFAMSNKASMQGDCGNASPSWKPSAKVFGNATSSPNPWNARNPAWKKSPVVPLLSSAELGQFSIEGTTVILDEEEVEATLKIFEYAIVGRLFGRRMPYSLLNSELSRRWAGMGRFRLIMLSWDCFVCVFETLEAREAVFGGGPWVILGQVLGVNRWSSTFSPATLDGFRTPVWIRMPGLPLYCWGSKNIARIVAHVGEPLWIDAATNQIDKGIFARACVQIDLSEPLKPGVWIQGRHGKFFQKVEYEGLSVFCYRCCQVGHKAHACKMPNARKGIAVASTPSPLDRNEAVPSTHSSPASSLQREPPPIRGGEKSVAELLSDDQGAGPWMMVHRKRRSSKTNQRGSYHQSAWNSVPNTKHKNMYGVGKGAGSHGGRGSLHAMVQHRRGILGSPPHGTSWYDMAQNLEEAQMQDRECMKHWDGESLNGAGRDFVTQHVGVLQDTELKLVEPQMEEGKSDVTNSSANANDSEMEKQVNEQQQLIVGEDATHEGDQQVNEQQHIELEMEGEQPFFTGFSALRDVGSAFVAVTAKARSRGGKIRGAKKEKMVCDLGPVAPGSRKRRKAQLISDGGDASPSPPP